MKKTTRDKRARNRQERDGGNGAVRHNSSVQETRKGGATMEKEAKTEMTFDEMIKQAKQISVPPDVDLDTKEDLADYL